jgi:hypothetical protein
MGSRMVRLPRGLPVLFSAFVCSVGIGAAHAQTASPPAHLAVVDGTATLDRDGQSEPAVANMPIVAGDRVSTTTGRVEVLFPDGVALDVDEYAVVDFESERHLRLLAGRAILVVPSETYVDATWPYEIDTAVNAIVTGGPGKYRIDAGTGAMWARADAFDGWSDALRAARTTTVLTSQSSQYLPQELQTYDTTFDQYGAWQYTPGYGEVWYPRVSVGWRPYYHGYWSPVRSYGWTWIGLDRWAWPTHHYGRWGFASGRWFWIPGRAFAPAWVSWASGGDYVGWCPLGFDSRPVFAMTVGHGNPWPGWTVLSRSQFGVHGAYVPHFAVEPHRLSERTPFVVQATAPVAVPRVAPRASDIGVRAAAAGVAVPRSGTAPAGARRPGTGDQTGLTPPSAVRRPGFIDPGLAPPSAGRRPAPVDSRGVGQAVPLTPQERDRRAVEPAIRDWRVVAPQVRDPRVVVPQIQDPRGAPAQSRDPRVAVPQIRDPRLVVPERGNAEIMPRSAVPPPSYGASQVVPRAPAPAPPAATMPPAPSAFPAGPPRVTAPSVQRYSPAPPPAPPAPAVQSPPPASAPHSAAPPAPSAPPPHAAPQRSAPAGAQPAGTATPRSSGGDGTAASSRRRS